MGTRPSVSRLALVAALLLGVSGCVTRPFYDESRTDVERDRGPVVGATVLPEPGAEGVTEPRPLGPSGEAVGAEAIARPRQGGVFAGSGVFNRAVPGTRPGLPAGVARTGPGEVTLNFVDADVREVLRVILGDTLGVSYLVDPNVQGTVTLRTGGPLPIASVLPTLENILAVNGAALIEADGIYKIVPSDQVILSGVRARLKGDVRGSGAGAGIIVVPLRHVAAAEMERLLQPFLVAGTFWVVDQDRNLITIGGNRGNVETVLEVIETFDVDWLAGMSFGLFPLEEGEAEEMVDTLDAMFGTKEEGALEGLLRFVPVERINSVLAISPRASYIEQARTWVERLDVSDDKTARIYVYYAENSRAADLAQVLIEIFGGGEGTGIRRPDLAPGRAPVELSSRGDRTSRDTNQQTADGQPAGLGTLGERTRRTGTQAAGQQGAVAGGGEVTIGTAGVRVIADEVKNALVILASPRDYRLVEQALRRLDIMPLQVLIEATILEVVLNDDLRYGVEWFFSRGDVTVTSAASTVQGTTTSLGTLNAGAASSLGGFTFLFRNQGAEVLINALDQVSDVNVVSSPSLFVLDNQTASLQVGDQVPVQTRTSQSVDDSTAPIVSSIEYRDTGVILDVTPRVNPTGLVTLEIAQEVSNVAEEQTTQGIDSPTIQQRRIETTVAVASGETVALGGLIRERRATTSSGLPFLSRIPFIGWLFGAQSDLNNRTELIVLITPRVATDQAQAKGLTNELRSRLRRIEPLEQRIR